MSIHLHGIVEHCSDSKGGKKRPWEERKRDYIDHLKTKPDASLLVSLADKTHNSRAIVTDLQAHGAEVWNRFSATPEQILWYYRKLLKVFSERRPSALTAELKRAVDEMHAIAKAQGLL